MHDENIDIREVILNAAAEVIFDEGVNSFTIEKVAKKAGISKGGLLYHFSTKKILIKEMIKKYLDDIEGEILKNIEDNGDLQVQKFLLASINSSGINSIKMHENGAGLLAAVATDKELIEPVKYKFEEWNEKIQKSDNPVIANIILLALHGIEFSKILGVNYIDSEMENKIEKELSEMTKQIKDK